MSQAERDARKNAKRRALTAKMKAERDARKPPKPRTPQPGNGWPGGPDDFRNKR